MKLNKTRFTMLDDVSGILRPGRLTLLLGPPGAGKSTLLNALAGRLGASPLKVRPLNASHSTYSCLHHVLMNSVNSSKQYQCAGRSSLRNALSERLGMSPSKLRHLLFCFLWAKSCVITADNSSI